jgi:hypothetical protein
VRHALFEDVDPGGPGADRVGDAGHPQCSRLPIDQGQDGAARDAKVGHKRLLTLLCVHGDADDGHPAQPGQAEKGEEQHESQAQSGESVGSLQPGYS